MSSKAENQSQLARLFCNHFIIANNIVNLYGWELN